jgi:hypothetical protein
MAQIALCYANLDDAQQAHTFMKKARITDKSNVDYICDQAEISAREGKTKDAPASFAAVSRETLYRRIRRRRFGP